MSVNSDISTNEDYYLSDEYPEDYPEPDEEDDNTGWEDSDVSEDSNQTTVHESSPNNSSPLLPPSSGPIRSSPIIGSKAERTLKRIQKGRVKRKKTIEILKEERLAERARSKAAEKQAEKGRQKVVLDEVLETLNTNGVRFWDLMEYVFNPANGQGNIRYNEFFVRPSNACRVLEWWMSANNRGRRAKAELREWVTKYAARIISQEAEVVTKSKELQTMGRTIDAQLIKRFDLDDIHNKLQGDLAPFSMRLIQAFTTAKGVKQHTEHRKERTKMVCYLSRCRNLIYLSLPQ